MAATDKIKIALSEKMVPYLMTRGLNYAARTQAPFNLAPTSFTSAVEGLKPKVFSRDRQLAMFERFMDDPFRPICYCVVSAPNDGMAKLFAAYLMQHAAKLAPHKGKGQPLWHDLTASFNNPLVNEPVGTSLLVLNNVGATSTPAKIEKLRDILTAYADTPRVVVATGADPFAFFTKTLYMPVNACVYLTGNLVRRTIEM